ncbi:MAG TPA: nucleotidyltransferase domain-containing protein [Catalimonadaceae bacterium]|nr:nucleotidyltransferase domain-containing protein [Catalimonadaceae bacterium]HPI12199.1 nucleotidyltransferase domain-containing protein [Catalimonadaceae bacterium]
MNFGLPESDYLNLIKVFLQHPKIEKVLLFGSRAKGTFRPGSDIDLVIYANALDFKEFMQIQIELDELELPQKIDLINGNTIRNSDLIAQIHRVGKVLLGQ